MPREKTGKYIECELEGCNKKTYYPPAVLKVNKSFFCSQAHKKQVAQIQLSCDLCGTSFSMRRGNYNARIKRGQSNFYCSRYCFAEASKNAVVLPCSNCKKPLQIRMSRVKAFENHFCDYTCLREGWAKYPKTRHLRSRVRIRQQQRKLSDQYIKMILRNNYGIQNFEPSPELQALIELKRQGILRKRTLNQINNHEQ